MQFRQAVAALRSSSYRPAEQSSHAAAATGANFPEAQNEQAPTFAATGECQPGLHAWQGVEAAESSSEKPARQSVQFEDPSALKLPVWQTSQTVAALRSRSAFPASQSEHSVAAVPANRPARQRTQRLAGFESASAQPLRQSSHAEDPGPASLPAGHCAQASADAAAGDAEARPARQSEHSAEPDAAQRPAPHSVQSSDAFSVAKVPELHERQVVLPAALA